MSGPKYTLDGPAAQPEPEPQPEKATVQDFCNQGCLQRLQIMDHQTERLEKALQRLEVVMEAVADIVASSHPETFQRKINQLTAKILKTHTGEKDETTRVARRLFVQ